MNEAGYWPSGMPVYEPGELALSASVVTVGTFDGFHRGHQALVTKAVRHAQSLGVPSILWTFDPPPKVFFGRALQITSLERKLELVSCLGVDAVVVSHFDDVYRQRSAAQFITDVEQLNPLVVCVGGDFRFGAGQAGDIAMLSQHFRVDSIETVCAGGQAVSSTRIRELLQTGCHDEAAQLRGWSRPDATSTFEEKRHA